MSMLENKIKGTNNAAYKHITKAQGKIPVDMDALCESIGIPVSGERMPNGLSGFIQKIAKDKFEISYNSFEPTTRQRFTIAHELAHYLLHAADLGDKYPENILLRGGLSNKQETQANHLAAEILMPYSKIDDYIRKYDGDFRMADLANYFNVSTPTMAIRLGIPMDI